MLVDINTNKNSGNEWKTLTKIFSKWDYNYLINNWNVLICVNMRKEIKINYLIKLQIITIYILPYMPDINIWHICKLFKFIIL